MLCLLITSLAILTTPVGPAGNEDRPNIVIIVSDDAGWADFGFQGSEEVSTPNLDALRDSGIRFSRGYVTASVCSPSRAGLLSGRYQQRFGHEMNISSGGPHGMPTAERTLAERLSKAGYATEAIGKWHVGYQPSMRPLSQGFDHFHGLLAGSRTYRPYPPEKTVATRRLRIDEDLIEDEESRFDWLTDHLGEVGGETVTRLAPGKPFLLYLSFTAPHTPMQASDGDLAASGDTDSRRRTYIAMQRALDRAIGTVLEAIDSSGESDRTIVWFVNDNGGATTNASDNGALRGMKGSKFEGGIRVPMLLRWPGVTTAGDTFDHPVSTLDIAPTVLVAAEAPVDSLDGVDLRPYLAGTQVERPHERLFWRRGPVAAVLEGDRWKLIRIQNTQTLLFDLHNDPSERKDVSNDYPEIRNRLLVSLTGWEVDMVEPGWDSGQLWRDNQIQKHQPDVDSRDKERSLP